MPTRAISDKSLKNLKSFKKGDKRVRKIQVKGGKRSVEVRKERKKLKEELELLMQEVDEDNPKQTNQKAILVAMVKQAKKGNIKAAEVVRDTLGEKPITEIQGTINDTYDINLTVN